MMIERQLSIALTVAGIAAAGPELFAVTKGMPHLSTAQMTVGTLLGAAGAFLGAAVAAGHMETWPRRIGLALWTCAGFAFAGLAALAAMRASPISRAFLACAALLAAIGPVAVWIRFKE